MKLVLLRSLHLFMAAVVLFSSMGVGLIEHSCAVRGKRVYSVYSAGKTGCSVCPTKHMAAQSAASLDQTNCCQNSGLYQHIDTNSSLKQLLAKFVRATCEAIGANRVAFIATLVGGLAGYVDGQAVGGYEPPPLPAGRMRLVFIQSFLI
jgi:hypothetical protein